MEEVEQEANVSDPIGSRLKAAREAQGMSLDDVAAKTRVPIRHLQHMERGEWDALPAQTYSVGFARAYAGAVGLNPAEIGSELRAQLGQAQRAPVAPYYEPADAARVPPRSLAIVAAIIAILLVVGYMMWRNNALEEVPAEPEIAADTGEAAGDAPAVGAPAAVKQQQPAEGPVVLTATSEVWLRVYEPGGRRLVEKTMQPGERFQVPADAANPQIITGRPNALQVTVGPTAIPPLGPPERTISNVSLRPADLLARLDQASAPSPDAPPAPTSAR